MSSTVKIVLGVVLGFLLLIGLLVGYVVSAKFTPERYENTMVAMYEEMQNVYANSVVQTLKAQGKVTNKYKDDLVDVVKANMERYKNDENLLFKMVTEAAGLTLTPDLHKELMFSIKSGYAQFSQSQKDKIDMVRSYKNYLNASMKGMISKVVWNYPSEKAQTIMDQVITNKDTAKTFATGEMEEIDFFKE